jgi:hypothetical protein
MVRVALCRELLLLVLILKHSDAVSDQCSELKEDVVRLQEDKTNISKLKKKYEELAGHCMVSG